MQRAAADTVLNALKTKPDSWTKVDVILDTSRSVSSKFFALSILEETIQFRWKLLPPDQREAVRSFIVAKVIAVSLHMYVVARAICVSLCVFWPM